MSSLEKGAAGACVKFLQKVLDGNSGAQAPGTQPVATQLADGEKESLEVARQCVQAAFHLTDDEVSQAPDLLAAITFISRAAQRPAPAPAPQAAAPTSPAAPAAPSEPLPTGPPAYDTAPPTDAEKEASLKLKDEGNELMKAEKFRDALRKYNEAIAVEPKNPVFYCNRAAAYYYLALYEHSLADCGHALSLNPNYGRAYGRMGLAYTQLGKHEQARDAYAAAVRMDPENDNYKSNLKFAETAYAQQLQQQQQRTPNAPPPAFGLAGIENLLNPALITAVQQMMTNPDMRNLMSTMVQGVMGAATDGERRAAPQLPADLGQRFAQLNSADFVQLFEQMFDQQNPQQPPQDRPNPPQHPPPAPPQ